jgi:hypothetical protein
MIAITFNYHPVSVQFEPNLPIYSPYIPNKAIDDVKL